MIRVEKQLADGVPSAWSCQLAPVRMGHLFMIGADATMTPPRVAVGEPVGAGVSSAGPPVLTVMR
jgi:hypothetical protein